MSWVRVLLARCGVLFRRKRLEEDLQEELRAHLEMLVEENIRRGIAAVCELPISNGVRGFYLFRRKLWIQIRELNPTVAKFADRGVMVTGIDLLVCRISELVTFVSEYATQNPTINEIDRALVAFPA